MTELERQLRALPVAVPEAPDLAPAVLVRLEGRPFPWRRAAVTVPQRSRDSSARVSDTGTAHHAASAREDRRA